MLNAFSWLAPAALSAFKSRLNLVAENLALRQQLATLSRKQPRPKFGLFDKTFWTLLCQVWSGWSETLAIMKPETVIRWHRQGFRLYWRWKSRRKPGRPEIPSEHIRLIRRLSTDHPEWGEDRIAEELRLKLGVNHSSATIRKYMVVHSRPPHGSQTWKQFVTNHAKGVYACDFLIQPTALFTSVYIFVVMETATRRIVHVNATDTPTLDWVKQQFRELSMGGETPAFVIHDNDGIFGRLRDGPFRSSLDRWLREVMEIRGVPTPFGTPNANAHVERFNRTLRTECLDRFVFLNEEHIRRVVREYVRYYNSARPHQGINAIPDPDSELEAIPVFTGKVEVRPVLGGLIHDYRLAA